LEENKLLILALRAYLRQKVESMNEGDLHPSSINWTLIEEAVARDFCVRREYLTELRRIFLDEGDVVVFGMENARGGAAENYDHSTQQKVSSKGRRLIILHAITTDGPLCDKDDSGKPVDDLKWKGDTCHPTKRDDGKLTCETLWVAQSSSGDYHDNMLHT
jgi:hypothetical protein